MWAGKVLKQQCGEVGGECVISGFRNTWGCIMLQRYEVNDESPNTNVLIGVKSEYKAVSLREEHNTGMRRMRLTISHRHRLGGMTL